MSEDLQNCCTQLSQPAQATAISVFDSILASGELFSAERMPGTATKPTLQLKHWSGKVTPLSSAYGREQHILEKPNPKVKYDSRTEPDKHSSS